MAKITLYDATLMAEDGARTLRVDVFNLPYGDFNAANPLLIAGNVALGNPKNKTFPDFRHVEIDGAFDCSYFKIGPDTVLPRGISSLICKCSINNLADLIGVLPDSVQSVVIKGSMLNAVARDSDAYNAAIKFTEQYPNVIVTDGKQTLFTILQSVEQSKQKSSKPIEKPKTKTITVPMKTEEYLSRDELAIACIACDPVLSTIPMDVLLRYIKMAFSAKSGLRLNIQEMKRPEDGVKITCVHRGDVAAVARFIVEKDAEQQARVVAQTNVTENKKTKSNTVDTTTQKQPIEQKYYVGDKEIIPVKIKKYILDSVWGNIQAECCKNTTLLRQILMDIDVINVVPKKYSKGDVFYVQDGIVKPSKSLEYKSQRCICQGFESQKSAQRIVWGVSGAKLIAQYFFAAHDGKKSKIEYKNTIRNIDAESDFAANPEKYLLVSDLIAQLGGRGEVSKSESVSATPAEPKVEKTVAPIATKPAKKSASKIAPVPKRIPTEVQPTPAVPVEQTRVPEVSSEQPVRKRRPRMRIVEKVEPKHRPVYENAIVSSPADNVDVSVSSIKDSAPVVPDQQSNLQQQSATPQMPEWVDIASLHAEYTTKIGDIKTQMSQLLVYMNSGIEVREIAEANHELSELLAQHQKCEHALAELGRMNRRMQYLSKVLSR